MGVSASTCLLLEVSRSTWHTVTGNPVSLDWDPHLLKGREVLAQWRGAQPSQLFSRTPSRNRPL